MGAVAAQCAPRSAAILLAAFAVAIALSLLLFPEFIVGQIKYAGEQALIFSDAAASLISAVQASAPFDKAPLVAPRRAPHAPLPALHIRKLAMIEPVFRRSPQNHIIRSPSTYLLFGVIIYCSSLFCIWFC